MIVEQERPSAGTIHSVGNPILFYGLLIGELVMVSGRTQHDMVNGRLSNRMDGDAGVTTRSPWPSKPMSFKYTFKPWLA